MIKSLCTLLSDSSEAGVTFLSLHFEVPQGTRCLSLGISVSFPHNSCEGRGHPGDTNCHLFLCRVRQDSSQNTALIELNPIPEPPPLPLQREDTAKVPRFRKTRCQEAVGQLPAPAPAVSREPLLVTEPRPCLQAWQKPLATGTGFLRNEACWWAAEDPARGLLPACGGSADGEREE